MNRKALFDLFQQSDFPSSFANSCMLSHTAKLRFPHTARLDHGHVRREKYVARSSSSSCHLKKLQNFFGKVRFRSVSLEWVRPKSSLCVILLTTRWWSNNKLSNSAFSNLRCFGMRNIKRNILTLSSRHPSLWLFPSSKRRRRSVDSPDLSHILLYDEEVVTIMTPILKKSLCVKSTANFCGLARSTDTPFMILWSKVSSACVFPTKNPPSTRSSPNVRLAVRLSPPMIRSNVGWRLYFLRAYKLPPHDSCRCARAFLSLHCVSFLFAGGGGGKTDRVMTSTLADFLESRLLVDPDNEEKTPFWLFKASSEKKRRKRANVASIFMAIVVWVPAHWTHCLRPTWKVIALFFWWWMIYSSCSRSMCTQFVHT